MIRSLGKKHTVILSSHILSEVSAVCDHIMIISWGKLSASGTPENLERQLENSSALELDVKGELSSIRTVLDGLPSIALTSASQEDGNPVCRLNLQILKDKEDENADVRETIFYKLAENRMPILSMTSSKASLEDVFLELTDDNTTKKVGGENGSNL